MLPLYYIILHILHFISGHNIPRTGAIVLQQVLLRCLKDGDEDQVSLVNAHDHILQ